MRHLSFLLTLFGIAFLSAQCSNTSAQKKTNPYYSRTALTPVKLSEADWKKLLPANVYYVARQGGTDRAFTSRWHNNHSEGMYYCAACGNALFSSGSKFESGTGWPSFFQPLRAKGSVVAVRDVDGYRTEVRCARCQAHLGHVFDDGPKPTGLRYCMNGTVLDFEPSR